MFKNRRLYHLSHIDLDGYSCQLLSGLIFQDRKCYNSNYGKEIISRIDEIFVDIKTQPTNKKIFILITDLNLTDEEAIYIENIKSNCTKYDIHIQLLDHHISGIDISEKYKWYHLNDKKSATLITYEFLKKNFGFEEEVSNKLDKFVKTVNALDIWLQDVTEDFEYGKVLMRLITSAKELNKAMFPDLDCEYKIAVLFKSIDILMDNNIETKYKHIYLDDQIHYIKKEFFRENRENDTIDNLLTNYVVKILTEKQNILTVQYKGYIGLLTYMLGNTSIIGNGFLIANPNFDFIIDLSAKGNLSFRASSKVDVSIMAKELCGGGGHVNASGGRLKNYRESKNYENAKSVIEALFIEKEYTSNTLPWKN
jgi:oligoribonuclease NrnB/cAMP/cGMP phosphodiesterase (DHH superfamily)